MPTSIFNIVRDVRLQTVGNLALLSWTNLYMTDRDRP